MDRLITTLSVDPVKISILGAIKTVFNQGKAKPIRPFDQALTPREQALIDNANVSHKLQ